MILDLLFPRTCCGCGRLGSYICEACSRKIQYRDSDICIYCRKRSYLGLTHPACKKSHGLDGIMSFCYFRGVMRNIIKDIKYRMVTDIYTELLHTIPPEQMLRCSGYTKLFKQLKLLPVPLHRQKLKHRGFNQSDYIAAFLSESYKLPIIHSLTRVINTPPQARLHETTARKKNIEGAFTLIEDVENENILLIDDVVTTGSTLMEAAKTLKLHGATNVLAITLSGR